MNVENKNEHTVNVSEKQHCEKFREREKDI